MKREGKKPKDSELARLSTLENKERSEEIWLFTGFSVILRHDYKEPAKTHTPA